MRILLIGSGGREHALAWRLSTCPSVDELLIAPGNPGTAQCGTNVAVNVDDHKAVVALAKQRGVDLVVVGPEDPLAAGIVDALSAAGLTCFGPTREAARLEADKAWAKELMRQQAVPTAEARVFTDARAADEYVKVRDEPLVIKAAGLAKGKGVSVCFRTEDQLDVIDRIMRKREFGSAGAKVVIEERLTGPECSILALVSGRDIFVLDPCQDHKPVDDGDTGPMTGGMGAYCPTPVVTPAMLAQIERDVLVPIVDGLVREDIEYKGVLYAGLMLTPNGPKVLEFNCRFGDPETQPLMMRLKGDIAQAMMATATGKLADVELSFDPRPAVCVVATSRGYPGKYPTGIEITGLDDADAMADVKVFHSGTAWQGDKVVTAGGRVLGVTALGETVRDAQARAYEAIKRVGFDGMHFRRDIAHQAIR